MKGEKKSHNLIMISDKYPYGTSEVFVGRELKVMVRMLNLTDEENDLIEIIKFGKTKFYIALNVLRKLRQKGLLIIRHK